LTACPSPSRTTMPTATMITLGLVLAIAALAAANQPRLTNKDGHVLITTGDSTQNVTDLLSVTKAAPLFKDQEGKLNTGLRELNDAVTGQFQDVERRARALNATTQDQFQDSTKTVAELLDELTKTGKSTDAGMTALVAHVKRLADAADAEKTSAGSGTPTKAAGAAFNPFTASFSSLGGDRLRVTFPKGAELIADPSVKMYQCKFTYLKDKKLDPTKSKISEAVAADTERTFSCVVPAWADKGKMPDEPTFTSNFEVLENGRTMAAPSGGQVIKWTPEIPSLKFADNSRLTSGEAGKAVPVSVDLSIQYEYGEAGYKDVQFSAATDKAWGSIITQIKFSGATTGDKRKMEFKITHPKSAGKKAAYWIDVTISSAKYKLSTKHRYKFDFNVATSIGVGGENNVLTGAQMATLYTKMGSTNLQLCYSAKLHGFSSSTMHSRCDGRGKSLTVMRRSKNGRVFGGYVHQNLNKGSGWVRGNYGSSNPWLFRVNPNSKTVDIIMKKNIVTYAYYMNNGYSMTWGGGHDLYCNSNGQSCYSNPSSYDFNFAGSSGQTTLSGDFRWNHAREGGSNGMVYEIYLIK